MNRILPAKVLGLGLVVCTMATTATAEDTATPLSPLFACQSIADQTQRLQCYDQAAQSLKQDEQSGEVVAFDKAKVETVQKEAFGFSLPSLPKLGFPGQDKKLETVEVAINKMRSLGGDMWVFELENGQLWQQIDDTLRRPKRMPTTATIRSASMGSYLLKIGNQRAVRVKRVR